jgi:hypothetical protein
MFRDMFQSGFLSLLASNGPSPLQLWEPTFPSGHVQKHWDSQIQRTVLELSSSAVSANYITCPPSHRVRSSDGRLERHPRSLGVTMPIFIMLVKSLGGKQFTFELQVKDDTGGRKRFRGANYIHESGKKSFSFSFPIQLSQETWTQVEINLAELTYQAFGTTYQETLAVEIHPNCLLHRVYFTERLYYNSELPSNFVLKLSTADRLQRPDT